MGGITLSVPMMLHAAIILALLHQIGGLQTRHFLIETEDDNIALVNDVVDITGDANGEETLKLEKHKGAVTEEPTPKDEKDSDKATEDSADYGEKKTVSKPNIDEHFGDWEAEHRRHKK